MRASAHKSDAQTSDHGSPGASVGANGVAMAPPAYGVGFIDSQPVQREASGDGASSSTRRELPEFAPAKKPHEDPDVPGIFLVGWTAAQAGELIDGLAAMAGIRATWDAETYQILYDGDDAERMGARQAEGRWSQEMHDAWVRALSTHPLHSLVVGAQWDDGDRIRAGAATSEMMILDMEDIASFTGESARVEQSFDLFWVMTHELLGHFYLGLSHGEAYGNSYKISQYDYEEDATLIKINRWRIELGLPVRLQHPPRAEDDKLIYIFVDAYPGEPTIDVNARKPDPNVALPPIEDRVQEFQDLREKVQNELTRPGDLDVELQFYPEAHYLDDDTDAEGRRLPGRGKALPDLELGSQCKHVKLAQRLLQSEGFGLEINGDFDKTMKTTVHKFQKLARLQRTGMVDKATWEALLGYPIAAQADLDKRHKGQRHHHHH